ncbi:hypothetical protein VC36_16890 [Pseudomonas marginalis]|nr:hypothetical protein VC37_12240 [Pseudomonas marginalis]KJZ58418.1 hypothetical protein VC36_16890 [Pseudomonas marginalis]
MLLQQGGSHSQIAVGFESFAGTGKTLSVITQVGLPKSGVDPFSVILCERLEQGVTCGLASGETVGCSGYIQGPRPRQQSTTDANTALL